MAKVSGPYIMPKEHAEMIGRVADAWAQLELQIDRGIWTLLGTHQQLAACLTVQMISVHPRIKALVALLHVLGASPETIKGFGTLYGQTLSGLSDQRNRAVHDPRMIDKVSRQTHKLEMAAKPKPHLDFIPEPLEELRKTHDDIYAAVTKFSNMRDAAIAEIDALLPESRPLLHSIIEVRKSPLVTDSETPIPMPPPRPS
jgi:hypothetical protein